jgi:hypothetical protein
MTNIDQAIKEAVKKGRYTYHGDKPLFDDQRDQWFISDGDGGHDIPSLSEFFLDPSFWQALGNATGWFNEDGQSVAKYRLNNPKHTEYPLHLYHWRHFIDHLGEGKDAESFFSTLMS